MNIYELNNLITQLENENNPSNEELICFYKKKQKELIKKINQKLKNIKI